jgi:hypothetical protein
MSLPQDDRCQETADQETLAQTRRKKVCNKHFVNVTASLEAGYDSLSDNSDSNHNDAESKQSETSNTVSGQNETKDAESEQSKTEEAESEQSETEDEKVERTKYGDQPRGGPLTVGSRTPYDRE